MVEPTMLTGTVTEVDVAKESFKIAEGNIWVSHTKLEWRKGLGPPLSVGLQISFEGFQSKGRWYANNIVVISQPHPSNAPQSLAGPHVPGSMAPTPAPVAEPPRIGPERVTPDPGSYAYRDTVGIPRAACLKDAVEALTGICGAAALERLDADTIDALAHNITRLADRLYFEYYVRGAKDIADVAMLDNTLVPTPSEAAPPPEYTGG